MLYLQAGAQVVVDTCDQQSARWIAEQRCNSNFPPHPPRQDTAPASFGLLYQAISEWQCTSAQLRVYFNAGAASKGLYRVHQFSKVELFVLCTPSQSEALLEELSAFEEHLFTQLGLHFKVLVCPLRAPQPT